MSLIYLLGPKMAVGVFAGAFLSNFETGLNWPAALAIAIGNSLESLFFVWAFNRMMSKSSRYGVHSPAIFGILSIVLATPVSASIGTAVLWFISVVPTKLVLSNWITWWKPQ